MKGENNVSRDIAFRILVFESTATQSQVENSETTTAEEYAKQSALINVVLEKLNTNFSSKLGSDGYRALLTRGLALAAADFPWLDAVHITPEGGLEGLSEALEGQSGSNASEGCVAIVACFIRLLETFIGEELSLRLLSKIWPSTILAYKSGTKDNSHG